MLSQLPVAATTEEHKRWGLQNTTTLFWRPEGRTGEGRGVCQSRGWGAAQVRCHRAQFPPGDSRGGSFLPLSASGGSGLWLHLMAFSVSIDLL